MNKLIIRIIILLIITAGVIAVLHFAGPIWDKLQREKAEIVPKDNTEVKMENESKKNPLYILDGEEITLSDLRIDPDNLAYEKLDEEEAVKRYGEKAKDGVFIFTTKKKRPNVPAPAQSSTDSLKKTVNN